MATIKDNMHASMPSLPPQRSLPKNGANGRPSAPSNETRNTTAPKKSGHAEGFTSFEKSAPASVSINPLSHVLPVTVRGRTIQKPAELAETLNPETGGVIPAVFLIEVSPDGTRKPLYSQDFIKQAYASSDKIFNSVKQRDLLGFLFPNNSYKEVALESLKEKDSIGYIASTLLKTNGSHVSAREFFEQKVLLSACLYLGWIEHRDESLAQELLIGLKENELYSGIQEVFHAAIDTRCNELVDLMIEWGADVNYVHPDDNMHPLQVARVLNLKEIEQRLLDAGAIDRV